jgi:hypothetical protein
MDTQLSSRHFQVSEVHYLHGVKLADDDAPWQSRKLEEQV